MQTPHRFTDEYSPIFLSVSFNRDDVDVDSSRSLDHPHWQTDSPDLRKIVKAKANLVFLSYFNPQNDRGTIQILFY